jgi:hypothetical protein
MKEKKKGGRRSGAGRKPSADPKLPVTIFVETSIINSFGGKEGVQFVCYAALGSGNNSILSGLEAKEIPKKEQINLPSDVLIAPMPASEPPKPQDSSFVIGVDVYRDQDIEAKIAAIKAEKIPKERDTMIGRKVWANEQKKRIEELEKQLK